MNRTGTLRFVVSCGLIISLIGLLTIVPWLPLTRGVSLKSRLASPSLAYPLGGDAIGRDLLLRLHQSFYDSILPLWIAVLLATFVAVIVFLLLNVMKDRESRGFWAAVSNFGGTVAQAIAAIPLIILTFLGALILETADIRGVCLALAIAVFCRFFVQLNQELTVSSQLSYWEAHQALGGRLGSRIVRYGLIAAWQKPLLSLTLFHLKIAIVVEASIAYLGFSTAEPDASIGNILSSHFDLFLHGQFWILGVVSLFYIVVSQLPDSLVYLIKHYWTSRHDFEETFR